MKEQLISFETAKLAKKKKFDVPCYNYYSSHDYDGNSNITKYTRIILMNANGYRGAYFTNKIEILYSAPTQSLLQKWLRDVHNIHMAIKFMSNGYVCNVQISVSPSIKMDAQRSYEDALEFALIKALKLIT